MRLYCGNAPKDVERRHRARANAMLSTRSCHLTHGKKRVIGCSPMLQALLFALETFGQRQNWHLTISIASFRHKLDHERGSNFQNEYSLHVLPKLHDQLRRCMSPHCPMSSLMCHVLMIPCLLVIAVDTA
eukprot:scaffold858_cov193-Alexandrium_tamarense.AAC.4